MTRELEPGEYVDLPSGVRVQRSLDDPTLYEVIGPDRTATFTLTEAEVADLAELAGWGPV